MTARRVDERRKVKAARAEMSRVLLVERRNKAELKRSKLHAISKRVCTQAKAEALKRLPAIFTADALGQGQEGGGGKQHAQRRREFLEPIRLRAPRLPDDLEAMWPNFAQQHALALGSRYDKAAGV